MNRKLFKFYLLLKKNICFLLFLNNKWNGPIFVIGRSYPHSPHLLLSVTKDDGENREEEEEEEEEEKERGIYLAFCTARCAVPNGFYYVMTHSVPLLTSPSSSSLVSSPFPPIGPTNSGGWWPTSAQNDVVSVVVVCTPPSPLLNKRNSSFSYSLTEREKKRSSSSSSSSSPLPPPYQPPRTHIRKSLGALFAFQRA